MAQITVGTAPPDLRLGAGPYEVRVTATQGTVDASVIAVISVSDAATPPSLPLNVQVVGGTKASLTVTWQKPTSGGDDGAGNDYSVDDLTYSLEWHPTGDPSNSGTATGVNALMHTLLGLTTNTTYAVTVHAHNANSGMAGSESEGASASGTTLVNNPPAFSFSPTGELKLPENTGFFSKNALETIAFPLEAVVDPPYTFLATDADFGEKLTFKVVSTTPVAVGKPGFLVDNDKTRSVGTATGVTLEYLDSFNTKNPGEDYESVANGPLYKVVVEVTDGEAQTLTEVKVRVTNQNEAPVVSLSDATVEALRPATGTRTYTFAPDTAYDPEGKDLTYQWVQVTSNTGATPVTSSNNLIADATKTARTVDIPFPALAQNAADVLYFFRLTVTDPAGNTAAAVATLTLVAPEFANNSAPSFTNNTATFSLNEVPYNLPSPTVPTELGNIPFTDTRQGVGVRKIVASISNPSVEVARLFEVEDAGGPTGTSRNVTLSYMGIGEDFEEDTKTYTFTVRVQDEGGGSDTVGVTVNLADLQDYPDTPDLPTATATDTDKISVSWSKPATRNKKSGTDTYYQYTDFELRYRPTGSDTWMMQTAGDVTTASVTGLMVNTPYEVQVRGTATDQGNDLLPLSTTDWPEARRWSPSALVVTQSAAPPVFAAGAVTRTIAENTPATDGSTLGGIPPVPLGAAVTATNPPGVSGTILYSLVFDDAADQALFSINSSSGIISSIAPLDFEVKSQYTFNVIARRIDNSSASKLVQVNVTDVSEPTQFLLNGLPTISKTLNRAVPENSVAGTLVGAPVTAIDDDTKDGIGALTYTLADATACKDRNNDPANCANYFAINGTTGQITVKTGFTVDDYDLGNNRASYAVEVTATDASDNPAPRDAVTVTVFIAITNVEEPPMFIEGLLATVMVPENAPRGAQIHSGIGNGAFTAIEPDTGAALLYNTGDTGDYDSFVMDRNTGVLNFKRSTILNHDTKPSYSLALKAIHSPVNSGTFNLTVLITEVNETPVFSSDPASVAFTAIPLQENVTTETKLLTIVVTDPDGDPGLTFGALTGDTTEGFSLRILQDAALKAAGTIKADLLYSNATPKDFETATDKEFSLGLTVNDNAAGFDNGEAMLEMTVNLVNVNEAPTAVGTIPTKQAERDDSFTIATADFFMPTKTSVTSAPTA